jgi:hypothetical protein
MIIADGAAGNEFKFLISRSSQFKKIAIRESKILIIIIASQPTPDLRFHIFNSWYKSLQP